MEITRRSRLLLRLQNLAFTVLFIGIIGLLAWLSTQYIYQADWTTGNRNTISAETRKLLEAMEHPVSVTAYAREDELLRRQIQNLIASYRRFKKDISLEFVNPDTAPERVREAGITVDGEMIVSYQGRSDSVETMNEQQLTNALLRISRQEEHWIVFLTGHGERSPGGEANHGLGVFGQELQRKGLRVEQINLAETSIPSNTHVLVLASPRVNLLPGEVRLLSNYLKQGGNLLWLAEPGSLRGLDSLAELLGIEFLPGVIVDATTRLFGIQNPSNVLVTAYPNHAITREMDTVTVFPEAAALETQDADAWLATPLLTTLSRSWTELKVLEGEIQFDEGSDERAGPLDLGVALTRTLQPAPPQGDESPAREQRVVVIGDGDFLSNTFIGNAGNLDLGLNLVHWLSHDDAYINVRVKSAPDTTLELGRISQAIIGFGFLIGMPLLLLVSGILVWIRRRRR